MHFIWQNPFRLQIVVKGIKNRYFWILPRIAQESIKIIISTHHHIVPATALIHRTARPSISAMSSLLGISPKCVQLVMIWFRSHVAAPHMYSVCSHGSPTDVSLPGLLLLLLLLKYFIYKRML